MEKPAKITRQQRDLTEEQRAYAVQFALERITTIFTPPPADESVAENHLRQAYRIVGLEPPRTIRWFDSPLAFTLTEVRSEVWSEVRSSVQALLNADDCAFLWFFHDLYQPNDFIHFAQFNELTHGYYLGAQEAWLVRRAERVCRDDRGRLHSGDGMAIQYRDGWGVYAWHGVRVPEQVILRPETLTKQDWLTEQNLEVRRVMQERLDPAQFVTMLGAKSLHRDECGELVEVDLGDDPERFARYVHVQDSSTDREYYLRVPPDTQRARAGIAWTFNIPEAEYCPLQEA